MKLSKVTKSLIKLEELIQNSKWTKVFCLKTFGETKRLDLWLATSEIARICNLSGMQDYEMCGRLASILPSYSNGGIYSALIDFSRARNTNKALVIEKIREAISLSLSEDARGN